MTTDPNAAPDRPGEPLDSYAAIGDGRTIALIGRRGQIDWMPVPDIGSEPLFARLLDDDRGGCIELEPIAEYTVRRRYIPGTNVLETEFTTESGRATVTDALVVGVAGRLPWSELARRVVGVRGEVEFTWRVRPGTLLGTAAPWLEMTERGAVIRCGQATVAVVGEGHAPEVAADDAEVVELRGRAATSEGSRHLLVVVATHDEPLRVPDPSNVDRGVDRTIENWRLWSQEFSYDGPWAEHVQRSALALKLLVYAPTGAIVAAGTTSLPETGRGGKNWDYRFAWVRDLAYTVHSLVRFGLREETHAALSWLSRAIRTNGQDPHLFYGLDGTPATRIARRDAPGWRGIGPSWSATPPRGSCSSGCSATFSPSAARTSTRAMSSIEEHGWNEEVGAYVMHPGTSDLDASVLLHAPSGFDRGERMSRTIDALHERLGADDLLYRYTGAAQEEHTFVACAFWRASALACVGRQEEAVDLMDRLVTRSNDVGILLEMIGAEDGAFWGNLPQALSHLALVNSALTIWQLTEGDE